MRSRASVLIGRDSELAALHHALGQARDSRGGAVFLAGEPGIGKSRLAAAATGAAFEAGMRTLRGRGSTIGPMVPYRPLTEALLSLLRSGGLPDTEQLGAYRPVLGRLIPELGWGPAPHDAGSVVVLAEAVLRLLTIVGQECGCLLVLEDLQDADAETLAVVEYLVDNLDSQPIALVATIRSEPCSALDLARSAGQRGAAELLELSGLDRDQVVAMAASCLEVPADRVPTAANDHLWADSAGIPFVVEELLHEMLGSGLLVPREGGWQVVGELRTQVPAAVVRSVAHRTNRLGDQARALLSMAAVLGNRFSLAVVRKATATDDRTILANLHAGVAAQLVVPDEPAPDWYAFRHPLTAEALLAGLTPSQRADLSRQAADAVEALHPQLPGDWCALVASLRLDAGDSACAGRLFTEAGRRALLDGAPDSAVALLERANTLLAGRAEPATRADVLESLLSALGEIGQSDRAFELLDTVAELVTAGLPPAHGAALHAQVAGIAHLAGRWVDGIAQVEAARALLGPDAGDEDSAPVDVVAAYLTLGTASPDRLRHAATLARRAGAAAERVPLPVVACEAWQLLGVIAREHDLVAAGTFFARSLELAERHQLPVKRIYALVMQAGSTCLVDGDPTELERARDEAYRIGAIALGYDVDGILALQAVLRAEFGTAGRLIEECWQAIGRLKLVRQARYLLVAKAMLAAHQADRNGMEEALAEFRRRGGGESYELPLAFGLARTFCALLEENRELAERELAQALAFEAENPTTFHLAGKHGLHLLLGAIDGRVGWPHYREITAAQAASMRWNSQFVHLAHAVLLGRDGRAAEAEAAMAVAREVGAVYPIAAHLGLRLVAEAAHSGGWGAPVEWLRIAESYFHQAGVPAVAAACRASLRRIGATVPQRRGGTDRVPSALRTVGVTLREYEVFQLLVERMGNKAIANQLHISPRTVEKHVASLIQKTRQPDRASLSSYARMVLTH